MEAVSQIVRRSYVEPIKIMEAVLEQNERSRDFTCLPMSVDSTRLLLLIAKKAKEAVEDDFSKEAKRRLEDAVKQATQQGLYK